MPAQVNFNWQDNSGTGLAESDDQAVLLVHNPVKAQYVFLENAAERSEGEVDHILPANFSGDEVDCWMSFSSIADNRMDTSVYIGKVTVA